MIEPLFVWVFSFREKTGDFVSERPKDVFSAGEVPRRYRLQEGAGWWFGSVPGGVLTRPPG